MSATATDERATLYAMDEAIVMFPRERAATAAKARYLGWQELEAAGMVTSSFYPPCTTAHVRWVFRFTADPFAELTHRYGDAWTPGAYPCWIVEVDPGWA